MRPITAEEFHAMASSAIATKQLAGCAINGHEMRTRVTLTIQTDGTVQDLVVAPTEPASIASCLARSIRTWRFRETERSSMFKFALAFGG